MAQYLIAAGGHKASRNSIIAVCSDDHKFGRNECWPNYLVVKDPTQNYREVKHLAKAKYDIDGKFVSKYSNEINIDKDISETEIAKIKSQDWYVPTLSTDSIKLKDALKTVL